MESSEGNGTESLICEKIAEPMPDIAGIGILLGFSAQAFISMVLAIWVFFLSKLGHIDVPHDEGTAEFESEQKRLSLISSMLMVGNDVQMLTGTALIITAYSSGSHLDLYHMHLVYDTVCFVGISNCAALACYKLIRAKKLAHRSSFMAQKKLKGLDRLHQFTPRFRATCAYAVLFLILAVMLEINLSKWSLTHEETGYCYRTDGIAASGASHPSSDQIYVAFTAIWLLGVMLTTIFGSINLRKPLLILSILQFPLHLYFMIALRHANTSYLEGEESEDDWDFGQTTAMLLLATVIVELFHKGAQYYKFNKDVNKYGPAHAIIEAQAREEKEKEDPGLQSGPLGLLVSSILERRSRSEHGEHEDDEREEGYEMA